MTENPLGLAELIQQVKRELLSIGPGTGTGPLFYVGDVTLELQVTVKKEGEAGIKIHIIQVGGNVSREDVHTITVTLSQLMSKEELKKIYEQHGPGGLQAMQFIGYVGGLKGDSQESEEDTFNTGSGNSK